MGMIDRDPHEMINFANKIDLYADNMRLICGQLLNYMGDAKPFMRDNASKQAFMKIEEFRENLLRSLPEALNAADKLRTAAAPLKRAIEIGNSIR
ncbi:MAG: hypothetical protein FWD47_05740 [Treponema sp.]|nr:hypothetical protein [Treponema sp.]